MRVRILCTEAGLKSRSLKDVCRGLSTSLGYKVFRATSSKPNRKEFRYGDLVDKLKQYQWFKENGVSSFDFTQDRDEVVSWLSGGFSVFGRTLLNSSCGKGIVVLEPGTTDIPSCPVYTKYEPKKREFRVHLFNGECVAVVEKKRRSDWTGERNSKIRNLENGFVFTQTVENEPAGLRELAKKASGVTRSAFAGVDVGYNEKKDFLFVIEVNSAPGIQGTNVEKYVQEILKHA